MQIKNFNTVLSEIQTHLEDYLQSKGFDTAKNFKCINPKHNDKNPSCGLLPGRIRAFCHSEGRVFDIFDAFCLLENKDNHGIGFITEVIQPLAAQFNIPIEMGEISEEKLFELEVFKAYRDVAEYITQSPYGSNIVPKEIKENRHWLRDVLVETNTGTVKSYEHFKSYLTTKGYTSEFLTDVDLLRSDIFNENNVIFTTHDEYGNPVGFAARNCLWKKGDTTGKYINQRTTGIKANIYRKGERLYGFHLARKEEGPIYIFEGQGDMITARQAGLKNCCAIGSTALTTEHISLLKEFNKYNVVLCLDGDNAGQEKIAKLLDTRFAGHKEMQVSIIIIPNGEDPDSFIREKGLEEFNKLARRTAFEWRLNCFTESSDPIEICRAMVPFIVNEPSYLIQEDMAKTLAKVTGYSVQSIQAEVGRLQNAQEERRSLERTNVIDKALKSARDNPDDAEIILTEARTQLLELAKKYDDDTMSEQEFLKQVLHQRNHEESKSDKFSGFVLSPELKNFQTAMAGEWDKDVLCVFGGKANCFDINQDFLDPLTGLFIKADKLNLVNSIDIDNEYISTIEKKTDYIISGTQECFKVTNSTGNTVVTTDKHRYLTPTGWKTLSEIKVGDKIAQPSILSYNPTDHSINEDEALFLGLMIGDGSFTTSRPLFTSDDTEILQRIKILAPNCFGENIKTPVYMTRDNNATYEMIGFTQKDWKTSRDENGYCNPNPITEWFRELNLLYCDAEEKFIPSKIFQSELGIIKNLLIGLFSTDGSIHICKEKKNTRIGIDYSSKSKQLIRQIQHLLLRFGIVASIRKRNTTCQTGTFESWYLSIRDQHSVYQFIKQIGFIGRRQSLTNTILENYFFKKNNKYINGIYWGKIKSIEPAGRRLTCDITVDNTSNFSIDGFVLHNSGKSAFLSKLSYDIASHEENDAIAIYHTIDDSREQLLPRFVCIAEGSHQLSINSVRDPNYWAKEIPNLLSKRASGYDSIEKLIKTGRLIIKDANHGTSLSYVENLIQYYRERYPHRKLIYFLDNFHKLNDYADSKDERVRFKKLSKATKGLATTYHVPIISTMEYTKLAPGTRPSNNNIAETVSMEYDSNLIVHIYNDLHEMGPQATIFHNVEEAGKIARYPRVEMIFGKNKITSFKDSLYFDFFPAASDFIGIDRDVIAAQLEASEKAKDAQNHKEGKVNPGGMYS